MYEMVPEVAMSPVRNRNRQTVMAGNQIMTPSDSNLVYADNFRSPSKNVSENKLPKQILLSQM